MSVSMPFRGTSRLTLTTSGPCDVEPEAGPGSRRVNSGQRPEALRVDARRHPDCGRGLAARPVVQDSTTGTGTSRRNLA